MRIRKLWAVPVALALAAAVPSSALATPARSARITEGPVPKVSMLLHRAYRPQLHDPHVLDPWILGDGQLTLTITGDEYAVEGTETFQMFYRKNVYAKWHPTKLIVVHGPWLINPPPNLPPIETDYPCLFNPGPSRWRLRITWDGIIKTLHGGNIPFAGSRNYPRLAIRLGQRISCPIVHT